MIKPGLLSSIDKVMLHIPTYERQARSAVEQIVLLAQEGERYREVLEKYCLACEQGLIKAPRTYQSFCRVLNRTPVPTAAEVPGKEALTTALTKLKQHIATTKRNGAGT
jgi:hypothetical protein